jgi:hypothetical protein
MDVISKRIALSALALAAVLLPMRKHSSDIVMQQTADRSLRLDSLWTQGRVAQYSWTAFELRDSARALLAMPHVESGRPQVSLLGFPAGTSTADGDVLIDELWRHVGASNPKVHTSVLVYSSAVYHQPSYTGAMITAHDGHVDCVAIAPVGAGPGGQGRAPLFRHQLLRQALAPCALLAAFGPPGKGADAWLTSTRYGVAESDDWLVQDPLEQPSGPWVDWSDNGGFRWPESMFGWMRVTGALDIAQQMQPHYSYGAAGLRCLDGNQADCTNSVLHSAITPPAATVMPPELTLTSWRSEPSIVTVGTVRPPASDMISSLIVEYGRVRFQKFWASDRPFESAFEDAFGETLGAWTARWSQQKWSNTFQAKHINTAIMLGVTLRPSWIPLLPLWTAIALSIAAWVARRRTA